MVDTRDFSGRWHFCHWAPDREDKGEITCEYDLDAKLTDHGMVLETEPGDKARYLLVRLSIDGDIASGTWHENTTLGQADDRGMYSGAGELLIDQDGRHMNGMWAGTGYDYGNKKAKIYTGRWELTKLT